MVANALGCAAVGIELNPEYCKLAEKRMAQSVLDLTTQERPIEASANGPDGSAERSNYSQLELDGNYIDDYIDGRRRKGRAGMAA